MVLKELQYPQGHLLLVIVKIADELVASYITLGDLGNEG